MGENRRRDLFRHLIDDNADDYLAIVTCLSGTLVSDLSAADIAARIPGSPLSADIVEQRCRRLVEWGNLTATRPVGVNTDTDRDRFRVTVFGGRVHREATAVLTAHDGARDVAREVLGLIASDLDRLTDALRTARVDPDAVAGLVTSVFTHHRTFTDSIADFYAHLADVLARLELSRDDVGRLKTLLLEYVDLLDGDVTSHTPVIAARLGALIPRLDPLLAALPGPPVPDGTPVARPAGRARSDWEELAAWYAADAGPRQLREAAGQALGRLLGHTRRHLAPAGAGGSRRSDLLALAGRFAESSDAQAHRLFTAAFAAYPSRHLLLGPDEPDPRIGPGTSWWDADPVPVPVSLRERGDRSPRGHSARVPDPTADRRRIAALARADTDARRAAAAELAAAGDLNGATVSAAARELLLDRLAALLARHRTLDTAVRVHDSDLGLCLHAAPGPDTVVHGPDGDLTVHAVLLRATVVDSWQVSAQ
ncbi:DUF2397 domain-containing protein [Rhodococcus phenolicus]|uniref:DUF2397 domain-containing protein n=1 Tax=Rhodococcus phenolicus TaxID=263849 RepID=UPI000837A292|nr:DUF2397 domain-containing protein [Rhodococcus phenolicus]